MESIRHPSNCTPATPGRSFACTIQIYFSHRVDEKRMGLLGLKCHHRSCSSLNESQGRQRAPWTMQRTIARNEGCSRNFVPYTHWDVITNVKKRPIWKSRNTRCWGPWDGFLTCNWIFPYSQTKFWMALQTCSILQWPPSYLVMLKVLKTWIVVQISFLTYCTRLEHSMRRKSTFELCPVDRQNESIHSVCQPTRACQLQYCRESLHVATHMYTDYQHAG